MSAAPPTELEPSSAQEPRAEVRPAPTLAGYVGVAVGLLGMAVLFSAAGAVDERVALLWNPGALAAAALGIPYAEPRRPLWHLGCAGAVLGLSYAGLVLAADAVSAPQLHLGRWDVLWRGLAIGVAPAVAGGLAVRWFGRGSPGRRRN